jgi:hypothetical protein
MAYAPILDSSAFVGDEQWRRVTMAAAATLQQLAKSSTADLQRALAMVEHPDSAKVQQELRSLPIVAQAIGRQLVPEEALVARLSEQLEQVNEFVKLDGGSLAQSLEPVANLIRAGRVELFAGRVQKPRQTALRRSTTG